MFETIPTYDKYRTLKLKDLPRMQGEDVYALQTALNAIGVETVADGVLGPNTSKSIFTAQQMLQLTVDGLAGGGTQKALALAISDKQASTRSVPREAMKGQMEHESGFRLGIYSPLRDDNSYDAGVAQRNTNFTPPKIGFNVPASIQALIENTRGYYELFEGLSIRRRWALAQGAWNAPAFACYIAREEGAFKVEQRHTLRPSSASRQALEAYIEKVTKYLTF